MTPTTASPTAWVTALGTAASEPPCEPSPKVCEVFVPSAKVIVAVEPASSRPLTAPALPAELKPLIVVGSTSTAKLNSSVGAKPVKFSVRVV